jgi:hypothetical protein
LLRHFIMIINTAAFLSSVHTFTLGVKLLDHHLIFPERDTTPLEL